MGILRVTRNLLHPEITSILKYASVVNTQLYLSEKKNCFKRFQIAAFIGITGKVYFKKISGDIQMQFVSSPTHQENVHCCN